MSRRKKKDRKRHSKQNLQQGNVTEKETKREEKIRLLELGPNVGICLPEIEGLRTERNKEDRNSYHLFVSRPGVSLSLWLDIEGETKIVSIGGKDYMIKEDKLIELAEFGKYDIVCKRAAENREFLLETGQAGKVIIDIEKIEGNDKIDKFLKK